MNEKTRSKAQSRELVLADAVEMLIYPSQKRFIEWAKKYDPSMVPTLTAHDGQEYSAGHLISAAHHMAIKAISLWTEMLQEPAGLDLKAEAITSALLLLRNGTPDSIDGAIRLLQDAVDPKDGTL